MRKILFLTILFAGCLQSFVDIDELNRQHDGKLLISQEQVNGLYQLMKDVHDLFALYNIEYWIQGGTLVGAERHKGLMQWDDDFDINVNIKDFPTIFRLEPILKFLGYRILIYPNFMLKIGTWSQNGCWIDIFPTCYKEDETTYLNHSWQRDGKDLYLYDNELYPLRKYQFGELQLWGPQDFHSYLKCGFGENYMEEVVLYNHRLPEQHFYCNFDDLPMEFKEPALPSAGLVDRVGGLHLEKSLPNKDFQLIIVTY